MPPLNAATNAARLPICNTIMMHLPLKGSFGETHPRGPGAATT
jgi:hypothetical protein